MPAHTQGPPAPYAPPPTTAFTLRSSVLLKPKTSFDDSLAIFDRRGPYLPFACGHRGPQTFGFRAFGKHFKSTDLGSFQDKLCGECRVLVHLKPELARCAHCTAPILPDEKAILCTPDHRIDQRYACVIGSNVVVCAGEECRSAGPFFEGVWKGSKTRFDPLIPGIEHVLGDDDILEVVA